MYITPHLLTITPNYPLLDRQLLTPHYITITSSLLTSSPLTPHPSPPHLLTSSPPHHLTSSPPYTSPLIPHPSTHQSSSHHPRPRWPGCAETCGVSMIRIRPRTNMGSQKFVTSSSSSSTLTSIYSHPSSLTPHPPPLAPQLIAPHPPPPVPSLFTSLPSFLTPHLLIPHLLTLAPGCLAGRAVSA